MRLTVTCRPACAIVAAATAVLAPPAAAAQQIEVIRVRDQQKISGELISDDGTVLRIRQTWVGKQGTSYLEWRLDRSEITGYELSPDPETAYAARKAEAKTAAQLLALAQWCRERGMGARSAELAIAALKQKDDLPGATRLLDELGWIKVDGAWVKEDVWLAENGKVRYKGEVMTAAEAQKLKERDKQDTAIVRKETSIAAIDKDIAKAERRQQEIKAERAKLAKQIADQQAGGGKDQYSLARAALDAARLAYQAELDRDRRAGGNGSSARLVQLETEMAARQQELNRVRAEASDTRSAVAALRTQDAALAGESAGLEQQIADLRKRRQDMQKEIAAARSAGSPKNEGAVPPPAGK